MRIDAFAHISPVRYLERVERILASPEVSSAVREHGPWLRADPVLFDLDARWRALDPFPDYRQVLVPPYETSAAMCRLVYGGVLDRHPDLRIITHHAGAMIPYFSGRFKDIQTEDQRPALDALAREPLDYLHRFYADTALFGAPHALRCAVDFFGTDHDLFGTDMPLGGPGSWVTRSPTSSRWGSTPTPAR